MKEIILISAYTPDLKRQDDLRNLVISLKDLNYRICLVTHTSTPQDIIDRCDYFLYDKENEVLYDPEIKYWYNHTFKNIAFSFVDYSTISTHMLPVFRMYLGGLMYLKSLGEEIVHMIEYDTIVKNKEMWDQNVEILKEKDAVFYSFPRFYENNNLVCVYGFQSVNVKNIPYDLLFFSQPELKTQYLNYYQSQKFPIFERMIFDNVWSKLNYHVFELNSEDDLEQSFTTNTIRVKSNFPPTNIHFFENKFHVFSCNNTEDSINLDVIINKKHNINTIINPNTWFWYPLNFDNIEHIKIFINNILLKELDLNIKEDKDWVFKYSYVNILNFEES